MRAIVSPRLAWMLAGPFVLTACPLTDDYYIDGGRGGQANPSSGGGAGKSNDCGEDCRARCTTTKIDGRAYSFCFERLTYWAATAACEARGETLAKIETGRENAEIAAQLAALDTENSIRAFVGASDAEMEGEWTWHDGDVFWRGGAEGKAVAGHYANWEKGQPANLSPVTWEPEHCLVIQFANGTWDDMRCELPLPYVCEAR